MGDPGEEVVLVAHGVRAPRAFGLLLAATIIALGGAAGGVMSHESGAPSRYRPGDVRAGRRTRAQADHQRVVVQVVQSTATLSERMKRLPDLLLKPGRTSALSVVRVEDGVRYQRILGFGAALTDSSAWLIGKGLTVPTRTKVIRALFSSEGIGLNYVRLPMGASDFTAKGKPYSYDDMPPGRLDPRLSHFSVAHDVPYIIPTLREALAINPRIFLIANPWSAPAWMKSNDASNNFGNAGSLQANDYRPFADYFVKFLEAYLRRGIVVDAITPENEPGVAANPEMQLPEPGEATFIQRYLRPALQSAGLGTQIYGLDGSWIMAPYADSLATGTAGNDLNAISWHCYYGSPTAMTQLHELAPQLTQVVNECSPEILPFSTAEALIGSLRNWASAVALWNLALDSAGGPVQPPGTWCLHCRGLVTVDRTTRTVRLTSRYYQLGQISKFVARGAVRIAANTFVTDETNARYSFYEPTAGLDDIAFLNPDGEKVLVTYNSSPRPIRFALNWHEHVLVYRQPGGAMTTFTWR